MRPTTKETPLVVRRAAFSIFASRAVLLLLRNKLHPAQQGDDFEGSNRTPRSTGLVQEQIPTECSTTWVVVSRHPIGPRT